jgi:hexosaminidase
MLTVADAPWRPWRGFSIDTGRHFHTLASLRAHVDAAAAAGLNVLHWHIADGQSWPLYLSVAPELAQVR